MAKILLQNNVDEVKVKSKLLGFLPITEDRRNWSLVVNYSEKEGSKEESFFLAQERVNVDKHGEKKFKLIDMTEAEYANKRLKNILEIVNKLEKMGYKTRNDKLVLFTSDRIPVLIFSS